jgi:hypothetical protein
VAVARPVSLRALSEFEDGAVAGCDVGSGGGVLDVLCLAFESSLVTKGGSYDHEPPWEPPRPIDDRLEFDPERDLDPDAIDPESWADELEDSDNP